MLQMMSPPLHEKSRTLHDEKRDQFFEPRHPIDEAGCRESLMMGNSVSCALSEDACSSVEGKHAVRHWPSQVWNLATAYSTMDTIHNRENKCELATMCRRTAARRVCANAIHWFTQSQLANRPALAFCIVNFVFVFLGISNLSSRYAANCSKNSFVLSELLVWGTNWFGTIDIISDAHPIKR